MLLVVVWLLGVWVWFCLLGVCCLLFVCLSLLNLGFRFTLRWVSVIICFN